MDERSYRDYQQSHVPALALPPATGQINIEAALAYMDARLAYADVSEMHLATRIAYIKVRLSVVAQSAYTVNIEPRIKDVETHWAYIDNLLADTDALLASISEAWSPQREAPRYSYSPSMDASAPALSGPNIEAYLEDIDGQLAYIEDGLRDMGRRVAYIEAQVAYIDADIAPPPNSVDIPLPAKVSKNGL